MNILTKIHQDPALFLTAIIGVGGVLSAILTLLFTNRYNRKTFNFQLEKDKREKNKCYNIVLNGLLKVYHSYLQHKHLYNEKGIKSIPDSVLIKVIDKIDTFKPEVKTFKQTVKNESEIVPELTIYLHELLGILGRFDLMSKEIPEESNEQEVLMLKRAHLFSVSDILDEYFDDMLIEISKKADLNDNFIEEARKFNSEDAVQENLELQQDILNRLFESIKRQSGMDISPNDLKE